MSTATSTPTPGDSDAVPGHRLSGAEAEAIAARVWPSGDLAPWLRTLYIRAVDAGRPWIESYLTAAEKNAIRAEIKSTAPRPEAPSGETRGGGV